MNNKQIQSTSPNVLQEESFMNHFLPEMNYEVDSVGYIHWDIQSWGQLEQRSKGPTFEVAGHKWNILLYPRGNTAKDKVSIYLEYSDASTSKEGWHVCAQFLLAISSPQNPEVFIKNNAYHRFTSDESDWGFTNFTELQNLLIPNNQGISLLSDDKIRISAFVKVAIDKTGVLWHNFLNWDSRKQTGHIGLKNQGATCYMNSLLQSLYFTNMFRKAVYQIPTKNDDPNRSVSLALQRVFYELHTSPTSVGTTELTSSFGWDPTEAFMQHDVQEFNRVIQDNLETKMKGTKADGAIAKLFEGKMKSYIECVNVNYESSRIENYYDISLNVKGCKTLRDSFVDYCQVETLEGDNKYMAEGYGLQEAKKGVIFESFPPVLHLHLKRFEYDFAYDNMVKINDRHEFPLEIDLGEFLSKDADQNESWKYVLHGVLVHSGDLNSGHYFALIRTEIDGKWFKFDDDQVIPVAENEVFEENYGGELHHINSRISQPGENNLYENPPSLPAHVHFKNNTGFDLVKMGDYLDFDPPIVHRVRKDTPFADFANYISKEMRVDARNLRFWTFMRRFNGTVRIDSPIPRNYNNLMIEDVQSTRIGTTQLPVLYCEVIDPLTENSDSIDYFNFSPKNPALVHIKYYDPYKKTIAGVGKLYLSELTVIKSIIPYLQKIQGFSKDTPITLYEEVYVGNVVKLNIEESLKEAQMQAGDIICFQKTLTDQDLQNFTKDDEALPTVSDYFDYISECIPVTFCKLPKFDNALNSSDSEELGSEIKPQPLDHVEMNLNLKLSYKQVAAHLAAKLGLPDSTKIHFVHASEAGVPRFPVTYDQSTTLFNMLPTVYQNHKNLQQLISLNRECIIFYEVLEVSLDQLEKLKKISVTFILDTLKNAHYFDVLVPKISDTQEMIDVIHNKVLPLLKSTEYVSNVASHGNKAADSVKSPAETALSSPLAKINKYSNDSSLPDVGSINWSNSCVYEVSNHEIVRLFDGSEPISSIDAHGSSVIFDMNAFESNVQGGDSGQDKKDTGGVDNYMETVDNEKADQMKMVKVFHFNKNNMRVHGIPFILRLYPNEQFYPTTWMRIKKKLGMSEKEFSKVRATIIRYSGQSSDVKPEYIDQLTSVEGVKEGGVDSGDGLASESKMELEQPLTAESKDLSNEDKPIVYLYDLVTHSNDILGLDHIDRSSRSRAHNESAIKILN
ncbi:hypothetical protein BB558_003575 [Smittium angustum]|uniref:ubiquitinyl hydrolase 1 n=1 Tax=Smittium angustum TaxID=133377 RepID=A0A2U1J5K8_SMIAN|nr:hypothetical protein BB558_003575 [Smittium angustum]